MGRIDDRLRELDISLPLVPQPVANYVPARRFGNLAQTAGQVSRLGDRDYKGKLGATLDLDEGPGATRACAINCLAAILTVINSLDQVKQIVGVHGFVNSTPDFEGQAAVMNGASDLMVEVFGDAGRHTRTAVGVAGLPLGYAASVYVVAELY